MSDHTARDLGMAYRSRLAPPSELPGDKLAPFHMPDGTPLELFRVLAHSPTALDDFVFATNAALFRTRLDIRVREILILRIQHNLGCSAEWRAHVAIFGDKAKLSPKDLAAIRQDEPSALSHDERVAVALADSICRGGQVSDKLWDDLISMFDATTLVEAFFVGAQYLKVAIIHNALGITRA